MPTFRLKLPQLGEIDLIELPFQLGFSTTELVIKGYGLPYNGCLSKRGDLVVWLQWDSLPNMIQHQAKPKDPPVIRKVLVNDTELIHGATKMERFIRKVVDRDLNEVHETKVSLFFSVLKLIIYLFILGCKSGN